MIGTLTLLMFAIGLSACHAAINPRLYHVDGPQVGMVAVPFLFGSFTLAYLFYQFASARKPE